MTYGDIKKTTLALIEEYSPKLTKFTEDEDIITRMPFLVNMAYQEMANTENIVATKTSPEVEQKEDKYTPYTLPSNLMQVRSVYVLDNNNHKKNSDYYLMGKNKIYINDKNEGQTVLEYYKNPIPIDEETENDYVLELDESIQRIIPYKVANDILVTDPSANYVAFSNEFQRQLQLLDTRKTIPIVSFDNLLDDSIESFDI